MLFGLDICVLWSFKYFKDVLYNNKNVCGTARCLGTTASTGWEFFHCVVVFCTFHCDAQLWPTILCRLLLQIECKNSHRWWNNRFFSVGSFFFLLFVWQKHSPNKHNCVWDRHSRHQAVDTFVSTNEMATGDNREMKITLKTYYFTFIAFQESPNCQLYFSDGCILH